MFHCSLAALIFLAALPPLAATRVACAGDSVGRPSAQWLAIVSATQKSAADRLARARQLRQRLTYTSDPTRANQLRHRRAQILDVYTGNGFSFSQIFGLSITEFDQILSSDVADEFGARDEGLGIDRAEELWEDGVVRYWHLSCCISNLFSLLIQCLITTTEEGSGGQEQVRGTISF